ncbi:hypothetical protein [Fodinicola feengrottensis]|nr:hypothetical protein [Fodinicola feengrottensis]
MIASRRRQLELHEEDEELATELDTQVADTELTDQVGVAKA